jgi:hypothetical protein
MTTWARVVGTLVTTVAILMPLVAQGAEGVIASVRSTGLALSLAVVVGFFAAVAWYCVSLQHCLEAVAPSNRTLKPTRVWLMYVPFYNITEDFFIIHALTRSLQNEARTNERLRGIRYFGSISGFGWCVGQVLSLIPTTLGEVASLMALVLWGIHWVEVRRMLQRLSNPRSGSQFGKPAAVTHAGVRA